MEEEKEFEDYAILELMGHRKLAGYVKWTQGPLLRIDVSERRAAEGLNPQPDCKCGHPQASHAILGGSCEEDDGSQPEGCPCPVFDPIF